MGVPEPEGSRMPKRIVLCFDGTWNTPDDHADLEAVDPRRSLENDDSLDAVDPSAFNRSSCNFTTLNLAGLSRTPITPSLWMNTESHTRQRSGILRRNRSRWSSSAGSSARTRMSAAATRTGGYRTLPSVGCKTTLDRAVCGLILPACPKSPTLIWMAASLIPFVGFSVDSLACFIPVTTDRSGICASVRRQSMPVYTTD